MPQDKVRIEARLVSLGFSGILDRLLSGPLSEMISLPISSIKTAKTVQRLLYSWLTFHPAIKMGVRLRVDMSGTILIIPCGLPERRGRRPRIF